MQHYACNLQVLTNAGSVWDERISSPIKIKDFNKLQQTSNRKKWLQPNQRICKTIFQSNITYHSTEPLEAVTH